MPALQSIDVVAAEYMGFDSIWPAGGFSYSDLWATLHASLATAGYQARALKPILETLRTNPGSHCCIAEHGERCAV